MLNNVCLKYIYSSMATFTKENGPLPDLSEEEQRLALEFYARRKQQLEARA